MAAIVRLLIAGVSGAGHVVIAVGGRTRLASVRQAALLDPIAEKAVTANRMIGCVGARLLARIAVVRCARNIVIARGCTGLTTERCIADFRPIAPISIAATTVVRLVLAHSADAAIDRAGHRVRTILGRAATDADGAGVRIGTRILIIAGACVIGMGAPGCCIAPIVGANVVVVAIAIPTWATGALKAEVLKGASATVVAREQVIRVDATENGIACIGRANVVVVAIRWRSPDARTGVATVIGRADVSVIAGSRVSGELTGKACGAGIVGTGIVVIAL